MATQLNAGGFSVPHPCPFGFPNPILNFDASLDGTTEGDSLDEFGKGFGAIFDNPIIGVGITSPGKKWVRVNDKWSDMIGYSREELSAADWDMLTHPDDLAPSLAQFSRLLSGEIDHYNLEKRYIRKDGRTLYAAVSINAVKGQDAKLKYVVGLAIDTTQSRMAERSLTDLRQQLLKAQEQERARIGRELHDDTLQRLASVSKDIEHLGESPALTSIRLKELKEHLNEISTDLQTLSHDLHATNLKNLGVISGIRSWCNEFEKRNQVIVAFESNVRTLPRHMGIELFRIIQEALQNVVKHSGAKRVEISLAENSEEVHLLIQDEGRGFNMGVLNGGLGLISMRERAQLIGGSLTINSEMKRGTSILVRASLR